MIERMVIMNFLQDWGIHPEIIEEVDHLCEDVLLKAGYTPKDIYEWRIIVRSDTVIVNEDITPSIIKGYFEETAKMLKEKGYKVNYCIDGDGNSSYITLNSSFVVSRSSLIVGYTLPTVEQLVAYEKYKNQWIKDHISDTEMTATEATYENNEEAEEMTFEEYLDEYGFSNGECYNTFEEFLHNRYTVIQ